MGSSAPRGAGTVDPAKAPSRQEPATWPQHAHVGEVPPTIQSCLFQFNAYDQPELAVPTNSVRKFAYCCESAAAGGEFGDSAGAVLGIYSGDGVGH